MGGLSCAKAAIDNFAGAKQKRDQRLAALDRQVTCMTASVNLSATRGVFPTEEMEAETIAATAAFDAAFAAACEPLAVLAAKIAHHCDPTKPPGT